MILDETVSVSSFLPFQNNLFERSRAKMGVGHKQRYGHIMQRHGHFMQSEKNQT
jgi:hypothetical protein